MKTYAVTHHWKWFGVMVLMRGSTYIFVEKSSKLSLNYVFYPQLEHRKGGNILPCLNGVGGRAIREDSAVLQIRRLCCCFTSTVNIYGHVGKVCEPNHTFPGQV